jgi:hypothetical protein
MAKRKQQPKKDRPPKRPKGSIPLPSGDYAVISHHTSAKGKKIRITAIHKAEPDLRALAKAFMQLAEDLDR